MLLEDLGDDRDGGVDRVGDDEHKSFRSRGGDSFGKFSHDTSVDLSKGGI